MNTLRVVILGAILIASLGACSSAGKCRRGELGCACQTDNTCESGALCVAERCSKPAATIGGSGGRSGSGGRGGSGGTDSSTAGRDATVACSGASFDAACRSFCVAFCESQRDFCVDSPCTPGFCDSGNYAAVVRPVCQENCGNDTDCARKMCLDQRLTTCETFFSIQEDGGVDPGCFENDPTCELRSN
jgi:hypothetical protein